MRRKADAELERALSEVRWVQENIVLVRFRPMENERLFGRRTIARIIEQGKVNYMSPCLELTSVLGARLKEAGFKPVLVVQELISHHTGKPLMHFALEVMAGRKQYVLDFKAGKDAVVYAGKYSPEKSSTGKESLSVKRMRSGFSRESSPLGVLGIRNWAEVGRKFRHVKFEHVRGAAERMRIDDSSKIFESVRKIRPSIRRL